MLTDAIPATIRKCLLDVIGCEYMEGRCECGVTFEDVTPEQTAVIVSVDLGPRVHEVNNALPSATSHGYVVGTCWRLTGPTWYAVQHKSHRGERVPWRTYGPIREDTHAC